MNSLGEWLAAIIVFIGMSALVIAYLMKEHRCHEAGGAMLQTECVRLERIDLEAE